MLQCGPLFREPRFHVHRWIRSSGTWIIIGSVMVGRPVALREPTATKYTKASARGFVLQATVCYKEASLDTMGFTAGSIAHATCKMTPQCMQVFVEAVVV